MPEPDLTQEQTDKAAAEAARIGGRTSSDPEPVDQEHPDESRRPLVEAGQGESEGFEEAERELVDHATHADEHAARRVLQDAPAPDDDARAAGSGEADRERSSEKPEDDAA